MTIYVVTTDLWSIFSFHGTGLRVILPLYKTSFTHLRSVRLGLVIPEYEWVIIAYMSAYYLSGVAGAAKTEAGRLRGYSD